MRRETLMVVLMSDTQRAKQAGVLHFLSFARLTQVLPSSLVVMLY
ncbi:MULTISPECIES: hypothetical protein [unclassified Calothrix]|nr:MULTISPECIES: hypothetical protein [unclassified Calothrix]